MKSLSDMINVNNTNSRFNYKEYIEPRFYESSIYFEGDESSTIYVNEHIIKYVLEERKREILNEIQKYNPNIQKLNIWDDKKGLLKNDRYYKYSDILDYKYIEDNLNYTYTYRDFWDIGYKSFKVPEVHEIGLNIYFKNRRTEYIKLFEGKIKNPYTYNIYLDIAKEIAKKIAKESDKILKENKQN